MCHVSLDLTDRLGVSMNSPPDGVRQIHRDARRVNSPATKVANSPQDEVLQIFRRILSLSAFTTVLCGRFFGSFTISKPQFSQLFHLCQTARI